MKTEKRRPIFTDYPESHTKFSSAGVDKHFPIKDQIMNVGDFAINTISVANTQFSQCSMKAVTGNSWVWLH